MNKKIGLIGSIINVITVLLFANKGGSSSIGGVVALEIWCLYFLPIGILSYKHFKDNK